MKTIFNPFEKYSEKILLTIGFLFALLGVFLSSHFNGKLDGLIDLHFVKKVTLTESLIDISIVVVVTTLVLFAFGKKANSKTRFVDILATSLIAKIPFYFLLFTNINNSMFKITQKIMANFQKGLSKLTETSDLTILIINALLTILFLIWSITLLYNGYKTATNAKGTNQNLLFALAILISEIVSKIIISILN